MDLDKLTEKLLKAAKSPADEAVPYAFEKRIMAHLSDLPKPVLDPLLFWARALWNAVPVCLALCLGAFLLSEPGHPSSTSLDVELKNTVMYSSEGFAQVW